MALLADLEDFVHDHRPHGTLTSDATEPAWNGYLSSFVNSPIKYIALLSAVGNDGIANSAIRGGALSSTPLRTLAGFLPAITAHQVGSPKNMSLHGP